MTNPYEIFKKGSIVDVHDIDDTFLTQGTIVQQGTAFARVVAANGESYDFPYPMLRQAGLKKNAGVETIKEEDKEGKKFALVKEEQNTDGQLSVVYRILVDDKPIQESEEIILNQYDPEFGWSEPDDFDESKVDLLKSTYESGFDLLVESYGNIEKNIMEAPNAPAEPTTPAEPTGKPAFAPGTEPSPSDTGDIGGMVDDSFADAPAMPEEAPAEMPAEAPAPEAEVVGASLEKTSFARSILASADNRLHNNPQHRINPLLRKKMDEMGIDSGNMNDIELANALKDYNFGDGAPKKKTAGVEDKPSIFNHTIYRLPTEEELAEFENYPNLSAQEIVNGFGYTMIGKGRPNSENTLLQKESLERLMELFPDRDAIFEAYDLFLQDEDNSKYFA